MKVDLYPWLNHITLRQLRGFIATIDAGSISAAARKLHLTTPAVSLQIRELEESIGLPLLERSDAGLVTTRAGEALLGLARQIRDSMIEFAGSIDEMRGVDHGIVAIGVVSTARYFAPMVIAEFMRLHPEVKIQLQVGNRDLTIEKLEQNELDFVISGKPPEHFEVIKEFICKHPQIIIAAADHPLADEVDIPLSKLKSETILLREPGSGTRGVADRLFARNKKLMSSAVEFGSNETIKQAVMAGMGIALISAHTVAAELQAGRLRALDVRGLPINRNWFLIKRANRRFLPSTQALWDFIAESGDTYLPKLQ